MSQALADLPDDIEALHAIIVAQARQLADQAERLQSRDTLIEKLKAQLAVIDRAIAQLERKRDADPTSSAALRVGMMRGDEHRSI